MKHKNARKITAFLLALVLILPIVSIPAIADNAVVTPDGTVVTAPNALVFQSFDDVALGKPTVVKGPATAKIVVGPDGRGNVLQIDCVAVGNENNYYVHFNNDKNTWAAISNVYISYTTLDDGTSVPYLTGEMRPLTSGGDTYKIEGIVNTNFCEFEIAKVTDLDGNLVEYADIIVKGYKEVNKLDEYGNVIWMPVLDENGQQVIGEQIDENGNVIMLPVWLQDTNEDGTPKVDENGNPVYVQDTNADGSLKFDDKGNPVWVQKSEIVLDENGNPIMDPVRDPVTNKPVLARDPETGKYLIGPDGKPVYETAPRVQLVYTPSIGPVSKTVKVKVNDTSKFLTKSAYITTEAFKDAYGGGVNNIAMAANLQHPALKSNVLIFSADYFFSAAVEDDPETPDVDETVEALTRGMDIRAIATYQYEENGTVKTTKKNFDFMNLANPSDGTITLRAHEGDAKTQLIGGTKVVNLGTWVNILIAADMRSGTYAIYIDGELMCIRQDADLSSTSGPASGHWVGPCVSINSNSWNLGHFTRGGKVEDYKGFVQIDNIAVYEGTQMEELFAYLGYSKEFEEDYEGNEVGDVLNTYFNGSTPQATVGEVNGNKVAAIDLTYAGNVDANFKPEINAVTYLDSKTVVLESDYYLSADAIVKFQSQIHNIGAHIDVEGSPFAYPMQGNKTYQWIDLYTVDATQNSNLATVTFSGATIPEGEETAPSVTIEKGKWNTFSTVINLADGSYTLYINGVYAIEGRLAKLINNVVYNFTDVSFAQDQWIVAKIMQGNLSRKGMLYLDEMMVTELGGGKAETMLIEAMLSADVYANGEFYKTVTNTNIFYKSSDIEIEAEIFDLKEQVGTDRLLKMEGASIRFTSPTGLRFASEVDLEALEALYAMVDNTESEINLLSVSFGTLIIPTDMLGGKNLSFETLAAEGITNYLDIPGVKDYYYDLDGDETTTHICGSIINIKESNIDRLFTGVNYVRIVLPNGVEYNIYSDRTYRASAQSVADDAWGEYAPEEQAVIDAFLAGVKPAADTVTPALPPVEEGGDGTGDGGSGTV